MSSIAAATGQNEHGCGRSGGCGCRAGKSAGYLAALTLAAWGIQIPMLLLAVPKFAERLGDFGVQLPVLSRVVIDWSRWMGTELFATKLTGAMVYGASLVVLSVFAFALAKVGGRSGRAIVVMLALLGGAIACGQAAAVILPAMSAQRTVDSSATNAAP